MYVLYSALLAVLLVLTLPYWLIQMLRHGKYREGLRQRFGFVPGSLRTMVPQPSIWIHAVSVGEVLAISGVVAQFRKELPSYRILVSTSTSTGQRLARARFGAENVFYFPLDFAFAIRPYLLTLRPELVIIAETEFWPNFLRLAHASGAQIAIVNARISDRSWPGYRKVRTLLSKILGKISLFLAQTDEDKKRLVDIGAAAERVHVTGNLKFDVPLPPVPPIVASLRVAFSRDATSPVLVCGSTMEGEESLLLRAFEIVLASHAKAVMILAPRHPERFTEVAQALEQLGIRFWRRSLWNGEPLSGGVLLVDTIGELAALYGVADIAFVGGSLVPRGGHNIIEPAQHGVAIVVGNHTENFRDIVGLFQSRNAVCIVGPAELPLVFMELIANNDQRRSLGQRAAETLQSQTGATMRTLDGIEKLMSARESVTPRGKATGERG